MQFYVTHAFSFFYSFTLNFKLKFNVNRVRITQDGLEMNL